VRLRFEKSGIKSKLIHLVVLLVLVCIAFLMRHKIIEIFQQNPSVYRIYTFIAAEIGSKTIMGLFLIIFMGSLFFITLPIEVIFVLYLGSGHNPLLMAAIAVAANTAGFLVNYVVGFIVGRKVLDWLMKDSFEKLERWIHRYGGFLLVVGDVLPFPMQLFTLTVGSARYNIIKFVKYSMIGQIIKYAIVLAMSNFILEVIVPIVERIPLIGNLVNMI
jgi:membrane protein YqaA with SNARE-associated domain